jgi:hypothetical protein
MSAKKLNILTSIQYTKSLLQKKEAEAKDGSGSWSMKNYLETITKSKKLNFKISLK